MPMRRTVSDAASAAPNEYPTILDIAEYLLITHSFSSTQVHAVSTHPVNEGRLTPELS
jgi:hypothetical protein